MANLKRVIQCTCLKSLGSKNEAPKYWLRLLTVAQHLPRKCKLVSSSSLHRGHNESVVLCIKVMMHYPSVKFSDFIASAVLVLSCGHKHTPTERGGERKRESQPESHRRGWLLLLYKSPRKLSLVTLDLSNWQAMSSRPTGQQQRKPVCRKFATGVAEEPGVVDCWIWDLPTRTSETGRQR